MSKLKRRHINEVMDMFCLTRGDMYWSQVYYADDADKVIAELQKQVHDYAQGLYVIQARAEKETRHQKYKRCLAMANYWVDVSYQCVDDKHRQSAERHHRKWLELAKKFKDKEAK